MENINTFGFIDFEGKPCPIQEYDCAVFNVRQNSFQVARDKRALIFRTSPAGDNIRHFNFVRNEFDFITLCSNICQLNGLEGYLDKTTSGLYIFRFIPGSQKRINIEAGTIMIFLEKTKKIRIKKTRAKEDLCKLTTNFQNENDVFEFANLLAAFSNNFAREIDRPEKGTITYKFLGT